MADFEYNTAMADMRSAVILKARLDKDENLLKSPPTEDEVTGAILDALDEINATMPETHYTFEYIYTSKDPRWKTLTIFGAARNIIGTILSHWTSEGIDATIGDMQSPNKVGDYQSLYNTMSTEFVARIEKLKASSQRFVKGCASTNGNRNILYPYGGLGNIYATRVRIR